MEKSTKIMVAVASLAVVCVCAAVVLPFVMGNDNETGFVSNGSYEKLPADTPVNTIGGDGSAPEGMSPDDMPEMDAEQIQKMLDMMQENGIDTTEAEEALENGDMDAVFAFMEENRPADGGPGTRPDGLPPQQ